MRLSRTTRVTTLMAGLFLAFSMVAVDHADARRGGSFGSRGARTFQQAPATRTAPQPAAPVERSMTPNTAAPNTGPAATQNAAARPGAAGQQRPGFMNGFGGTMLKGLMLGGLIGLLLGQGLGGLAGMFGMLLQLLLVGGAIWLVFRLVRSQPARSPQPAMAGAAPGGGTFSSRDVEPGASGRSFKIPSIGSGLGSPAPAAEQPATREIELDQKDLDAFERMLTEVQEAFGREDHKALRRLVTPEMVSYLSEELAENAQKGVRNDVTDVRLLQADIAEAWGEGDLDYATAALNYESVDVVRDRATGELVEGESEEPTETTELWTFVRRNGGDWQLSAIQQS